MALIQCDGISIAYEGQTVVKDLSFQIGQGDYLCIVGENGSGKSTLVKSLLGLKQPFQGEIMLGDGLKQNEIGYLPQQTVVQRDFPASVYEVVLSGRLNSRGWKPFYSAADKQAARENMELLGIPTMEHQCFRDLSGGQKQRVLLARALCATKKLLLLDEPVTGLDPLVTAEFYQLIKGSTKNLKLQWSWCPMILKAPCSMQAISCTYRKVPDSGVLQKNIETARQAGNFWEVRWMFDTVAEMLSYPFMVRAFLVGSLVALCSALLGVSLVLKRYSMIGDGLSHVGFGAMAVAAALNAAPLAVAIPVVVVAAVLLLRISGSSKIKGDAAIALISTGALAME